METLIFNSITELKRNLSDLEKKLHVKITISGKKVTIEGITLDEYEALLVLKAINAGFSAKKAMMLKDQDMVFKTFNIKDFTRRKNLSDVRARIIGREGQTKRTIEEISGCEINLKDNTLSIIGPAEAIDDAKTALTNLIRGSKQSNVYKFLEGINTNKKKRYFEDKYAVKRTTFK